MGQKQGGLGREGGIRSGIDRALEFWQRSGVSANPKSSSSWHWAESDHWEIAFHGLPRRFPWLNSQPPPPGQPSPEKPVEFPILHLYKAVEAMVQEEPDAAHDPRFLGFMRQIDAGAGFISAMENGDFIAAEGVIKDAERNSLETAYLLFNKAYVMRQTDRKEEAVAYYRRAAELAPDLEMIWRCYGETCEELGDKAEAIRAYHEARRILPNHQQATLGLERLGEIFRASSRDKPGETLWMTKAELRAASEQDLQRHWNDAKMLRGFGGQTMQENLFPDLALRALERAVKLDPENAEAQRNLGVTLRANGQAEKSLLHLVRAQRMEPDDPWTLFHMAESYVVLEDVDTALDCLDKALGLDANHDGALRLRFLARTDQKVEQNERELAAFSKPQNERPSGSWRGYLLAAESAWNRGAHETAVKFAAEAYKIAPENEQVFLTYTGMLGASGENEWVAALTKPRLRTKETNPRAWSNFARALNAMGLRDEAVKTLQQALAELQLAPDAANALSDELDELTERFAICGAEIEFHSGGQVLRRSIFQVRDNKALLRIFEQGMGVPNSRSIPVTFAKPKSEFDFTVEHQNQIKDEDPEPQPLGTFTISEIDPARLAQETVTLILTLTEKGELVLGALQGKRKLRVVWSLYPPPRHEAATTA